MSFKNTGILIGILTFGILTISGLIYSGNEHIKELQTTDSYINSYSTFDKVFFHGDNHYTLFIKNGEKVTKFSTKGFKEVRIIVDSEKTENPWFQYSLAKNKFNESLIYESKAIIYLKNMDNILASS